MELSRDEKELAREVFSLFDKSRDGWMASHDIGLALRGMGLNPSEADLEAIQKDIDSSQSGMVSFEEFCRVFALMRSDNISEVQITEYLKTFDPYGDGYIRVEDLKEILTGMGERLTPDELQSIIADFDSRHEGRIQIEAFARKLLAND
jgi:calmodulin